MNRPDGLYARPEFAAGLKPWSRGFHGGRLSRCDRHEGADRVRAGKWSEGPRVNRSTVNA
jgi:hypothetical protein